MVNIHDYKDLVLNWYDKCTASFAFVIAKKKHIVVQFFYMHSTIKGLPHSQNH